MDARLIQTVIEQDRWVLVAAAITGALFCLYVYKATYLSHIPTVGGPSGPLTSYLGAWKWNDNAMALVQEAYDKHKGGICKIALPDKWVVVLCGSRMVEELRKTPDEILSPQETINDALQIENLIGKKITEDHHHVHSLRRNLSNLASIYPAIHEEMLLGLDAHINLPEDSKEWITVPALHTFIRIIGRTGNRIFTGQELCRTPDFLAVNFEFALRIIGYARFLNKFPNFMKPILAKYVVSMQKVIDRGVVHLTPVIEQRRADLKAGHGREYSDMITWMLEGPVERDARDISLRILVLNFVSLFTTSMAFTFAIINLAQHPEMASTLREEVEACVEKDGWTKTALQRMTKLDSFIKESQRCTVGAWGLGRKAMKPMTFSNGTHVPTGTTLYCAALAMHGDDEHFPNPEIFDPWRFEKQREKTGENTALVATAPDFILFGHGRNACPGRFFASTEMMSLMANILLRYDVKAPPEGIPPMKWTGPTPSPHPDAKIMFKRRHE